MPSKQRFPTNVLLANRPNAKTIVSAGRFVFNVKSIHSATAVLFNFLELRFLHHSTYVNALRQ